MGANEKGVVTITPPLPPGCMSTVWGDDERFVNTYFRTFPKLLLYSTFDWGKKNWHTWSVGSLITLKVVSLGLHTLLPAVPPLLEAFRKGLFQNVV